VGQFAERGWTGAKEGVLNVPGKKKKLPCGIGEASRLIKSNGEGGDAIKEEMPPKPLNQR